MTHHEENIMAGAPSTSNNARQSGVVAIEFAILFPVFFALSYAVMAYGMYFLLLQSFAYAGEDALRAALATDCAAAVCTEAELEPVVTAQVQNSLTWFSADLVNAATAGDDFFSCDATMLCTVRLSAPPILDSINLPIIGSIPNLPDPVVSRSSLRM
jgi:Flp pilus assembly protein TadG|tara:strand:- start:6684 stop:7154 length:471 start_codon:yes stop_codon:yes gene_type:complete